MLLRERYAGWKKELLLRCCNPVWDENLRADSVECYCCLRNVQDLLAVVKTLYERRFAEPFKGPVVPFDAMVNIILVR